MISKIKSHQRVILVIGVTHSGTSVLTKGLETMGVSLGPELTFPNSFDQQNLWEDPDLHALNLEMLYFFGTYLRGIIPITEEEVGILCNEGFLTKASHLLLEKLPKDQPLGIKDPRFSVLLPFWKKVFQECHIQASFVIALRNPWSVAATQKQHVEKSFWIWISYLLSCLEHSEGHQRLVVDYDELLKNPNHQMQRMAQALELTIHQEQLTSYCTRYVDPARRHFDEKKESLTSLPFYQHLATEMYDHLLRLAQDKIDFQQLKKPFHQWKKEYLEAHSLLVLAEKNNATIQNLRQTIQQLDESIHQLHKEMNQKTYSVAHYCQEIHQCETRINLLLQEQKK